MLSHKYWVYIVNAAPTEGRQAGDKQLRILERRFPQKGGGGYPIYPAATRMQKLTFEARTPELGVSTIFLS